MATNHDAHFIKISRTQSTSRFARLISYGWWAIKVLFVGLFSKYDLVHAHTVFPAAPLGAILAALRRRPLMVTAHGSDICLIKQTSRPVQWLTKWALRRATRVQAVSGFIRDRLIAEEPQVATKAFVQCMGVNTETFQVKRENPSEGPSQMVFVGNLVPMKGWKTAFEVTRRLNDEGTSCVLQVFGGGPDLVQAQAWIAKHQMAQKIVLHGATPSHRIAKAYGQAALFLFPSKYDEAFSLATGEALATGTPAVVSDCGALPELVSDPNKGRVVARCDNISGFVGACREVLSRLPPPISDKNSLLSPTNTIVFAAQHVYNEYSLISSPSNQKL